MTISKPELGKIADELPISYYAKARVEVKIDAEAPTSYFSPNTREIFISLEGVNASLKNINGTDTEEAERAVRAHLYHELSHAILTPKVLTPNDKINIFEDERIETLLDGFFMKVDFKENIKRLCDFDENDIPQTDMEKFFYAVRYRIGKKEWLDEIEKIIETYAKLNWNSKSGKAYDYAWAIEDLYRKICNDTSMNDEAWKNAIEEALKTQAQQGTGDTEIPSEYDAPNGNSEENDGAEGEGMGADGGNGNAENEEGQSEQTAKGKGGRGAGHSLFEEAIQTACKKIRDENLFLALDGILANFNKKNRGGSALPSYSGIFNPRSVVRDDYKYFDRKTTVQGSNPYGSLHLNLFIDNSGSFDHCQDAANRIVSTLCDLERKYPFFTVDFAFCGDKVERRDKRNCYLTTDEGTYIDDTAIEVVKSMQKKNTFTYNIVLYDGECYKRSSESMKYVYQPFDLSNTTLILDPSCKKDALRVKNAKVLISQDYLKDLTKNILLTLQRAFR